MPSDKLWTIQFVCMDISVANSKKNRTIFRNIFTIGIYFVTIFPF